MSERNSYVESDRKVLRQTRRWQEDDGRDRWSDDLIQELPPRVFTQGTPSCENLGTELFYHRDTKPALLLCKKCPVRVECLEWALENGDVHGVQGGITAPDRRSYMGMTAKQMIRNSDKSRGLK